jgi:hypothetical protein
MKPYDQTLGIEKMCLVFYVIQTISIYLVWLKNISYLKNTHEVLFSYGKGATQGYVVMYGYGKRPSHCN